MTAAVVFAAGPPPEQTSSGETSKIKAFTDGEGNPVGREEFAGTKSSGSRSAGGVLRPEVQRGQAWWPYKTALPPYTAVGKRAEVMTEDEILLDGVATLSTKNARAALAQMPADLLLDEGSQLSQEAGFYLVKIKGFTRNQTQVDALEAAGAVLGEYVNINTYIAEIPSGAVSAVKALPFVTFVGDYHPAYKISPRIGLERIPVDEVYDPATGAMRPWAFELTLHKGANVQQVLDSLGRLGVFPRPEQVVSNGEMTVVQVETAPEAVPDLAKVPGVKWIAEKTYASLLASSTSPATIPMILQNNGTFTTNTATGWQLWNEGLDGSKSGSAQIITMMDTGLNTEMEHFAQDITTVGTLNSSHRKVVGYDNYGGDVCVTAWTQNTTDAGHGTWTSQHAAGSISNMTSNPDTTHTPTNYYDDGIARGAKIYFQDIGTSTGTISAPLDLGPSITAAIGKGSYIQSHSWGTSSPTYDTTASYLDAAIYANPGMVVTVAAGNGGTAGQSTIGAPSTAKNVICVGGADAANPGYLFEDCSWGGTTACGDTNDLGSARGPVTTSNRVKPDIVTYMAFSASVGGENEAGERPHAMCQTDVTKTVYWDWNNLQGFGGTSFAAPEAAGLAAIVRDYFVSGYYPTGSPVVAKTTLNPSGSLVKAMILASGEDLAATGYPSTSIGISKRYSNDVGYGRANLRSVLRIGSGAPFLWVQNNVALGDGATQTFYFNINSNSPPLRVMMVYYDAAGNAIQKDADLKVTIGSNVYYGNYMSGGWSVTGGSQDHTNPTEGVFLNAAHGLPSSGTVRVDVIGYNDPGGMNYSLVVVGDVTSQDVTQVSLDKGKYNCSDTVRITVNDSAATSPVSVTLTSKNGGGSTIDTQTVTCTGSGGVFTGTILTGSGITVVNGGSLVATYDSVTPATATVSCQIALADGGYIIQGGCDNGAAGTDAFTGPLYNGGSNEFYTKYMDAGEYSAYTVGFLNQTGKALTDARVHLSFSGAGASAMTAVNNDIVVGAVPADSLTGAVFQVYTGAVAGLTAVNMDFDITSPADGFTVAKRLTQVRLLQTNDTITRQQHCSKFDTSPLPSLAWYESVVTGATANPWRWSGSATQPAVVGSENRTDGICSSSLANKAMMVGNSATTAANNFNNNADSFLLTNFQPALNGNAPNGQPYYYAWKWHSFYHASEVLSNTSGVWGAFYNDQWNSAVNPTADQANAFPIVVCCYYQTILDYVGIWNWETANTGTPDTPGLGPSTGGAPNQLMITFNGVDGQATSNTYFAYGHEHADIYWFNGGTHSSPKDVAIDNDNLVYDEWYAASQTGASCTTGQVGQVAFDRYTYDNCPSSTAVLSVVDANATSPLTVTVTSPGTGDSEVVTLTGSAPYFSGTLTLATNAGSGNNNGVLFVLPSETITATYADTSPAGSTTAYANIGCTGGNVVYLSNTQVSDNGDNDGFADNNETVTMDITIQNNMATDLTNTKVTIFSTDPKIDCIPDNQALYGTVPSGGTATNPSGDRFTFHVTPTVACTDWQNPPTARFKVVITGDGFDGSSTLQTFDLSLDLDPSSGNVWTLSQNFNTDPGWTTGTVPDDDNYSACAGIAYVNNFHWCAACGNGNGGYGAWIGDGAFPGSGYPTYSSSVLYSPIVVANGNVTLQFSVAYYILSPYHGALVQAKVGAGAWTNVPFTTPAQAAVTTNQTYCSPLAAGVLAWTGGPTSWTATNTATVTASLGQTVRFRWRLGSDSSSFAGGYGVDNVVVGNLSQTQVCEATRNTGLPGCCSAPSGLTNNTATDLNPAADTGVQVNWTQDAGNWGDAGSGTRTYDVLRDGVPIATGIAYGTTTYTDNTGVNGTTYTYSVRYNNGCGLSAATAGVAAADNVCAVAAPTGQTSLSFSGTLLSWTAVTDATWYDVVRGTLSVLRSSGGNFTSATDICLGNDQAGTSYTDATNPAVGDGLWYLVRAGNCGGNGSYDEGQPSQIGSRDAEIAASANACP